MRSLSLSISECFLREPPHLPAPSQSSGPGPFLSRKGRGENTTEPLSPCGRGRDPARSAGRVRGMDETDSYVLQRERSALGRRGLALFRGAGRRRLAALQRVDEALGRWPVEVLVEIVVDLDDRRVDAGAQAFDLGQRELAVGRGLADGDAEALLAGRNHITGAPEPAWRRRADLEEMLADRAQIEHRVEGGDLVDADMRHAEHVRDIVHRRARHPIAVLALRQVEQRQHRARLPAWRILGDIGLGLGEVFRREGEALGLIDRRIAGGPAHRSMLPNTMSIEPMIATMSASMWPLPMKSVLCRKAKSGKRILQR